MHSEYNRLNKDIPYFDCYIGKIIDNYITTGEYALEEEFGDSDLSNYTVNGDMYTHGSAVYYKDSIIFTIQSYNVDGYKDIIINKLCNMYGLEVFDDGGSGKYLTKDNKKVIGYSWNDNVFFGFVNTADISDEIKTLFKRKSFEDTSFLDISLTEFCNDIENVFGKNLSIEVDTNYYEPIDNKFVFKVSNESFYINTPILFDENYNPLYLETTHSLKENDDGSYRYTKYFSTNGYLNNTYNIKYIDADLAISTVENAQYAYYNPGFSTTGSSNRYTSTNLTTARDLVNNTNAGTMFALGSGVGTVCGMFVNRTTSSNQFGTTFNYRYTVYQKFFVFDSSSISDSVTSATFKIKSYYKNTGTGYPSDFHFILLKSNRGNDENANNWNDFVGHTSGWGASDVTEYSADHVCTNAGTSISDASFEDVTLNSDSRTDLENNSLFEFAIIEKEEYYDNSYNPHGVSTGQQHGRQFYAVNAEDTTTSNRPYIEYETGAVSAPVNDSVFFGTNF